MARTKKATTAVKDEPIVSISNRKYEFTGETKIEFGVTFRRIRALRAFGAVALGELGGWIADESNLSHDGDAWVSGNAQVYGNALVYGNAQVSGNAQVYGNALVYGNAQVSGNARVFGDARVYGNARVSPINIIGLTYNVTITDQHMQIGCEHHLLSEWERFGNRRIAEMDGHKASAFWRDYKDVVLGLAKASGRPFAGQNDATEAAEAAE